MAVAADDVAHPMGRVLDPHLARGQPTFEEALEVVVRPQAGAEGGCVLPRREHLLGQVFELAGHDVAVVVAGQPHHALAAEPVREQAEERVGGRERVGHAREEEIEQVAEQDQLVDVLQMGREARKRPVVAEQVVAGPGAEVGVRDDEGAHRAGTLPRAP